MGSYIIDKFGLSSISPNYYVYNEKFPNKIINIVPHGEKYEVKEVLDKTIDTKILVYEDRVTGWFLDFAKKLAKKENSEFVVMMICMNYLEGKQQFVDGKKSNKGESTKVLKKALVSIFPNTDEKDIDFLIYGVRHGLFHDGMTKRGILLRYKLSIPFFSFISDEERWLEIDPLLFLEKIGADFKEYITKLKDKNNALLRDNFEKHYNESYEKSPEFNS